MSLQNKLSIVFATIAVIPLLGAGFLSYQTLEDRSVEQISDQLISISSIQEKRVNEVLSGYLEKMHSFTNRILLRASIKKYIETGDAEALVTIQKIIVDTKKVIPLVKQVSILDTQGLVLASTDASLIGKQFGSEKYFKEGLKDNLLNDVLKDEENILFVRLSGPFILDGKVVAVGIIDASAGPIVSVTEDHTGLGKTGEVLLAEKNKVGDALFLTPLRFDAGAALRLAISKEDSLDPTNSALSGGDDAFLAGGTKDYRGELVFASTRFIDSVGWGMVIKIDQAEVLSPINDLLTSFLFLILIVGVFTIAIAIVVARVFFRPIGELTVSAGNLQKGDFSQRVIVRTKDEIGTLGNVFNGMAEKLQELHLGLEQKVSERTKVLEEKTDELERMNKLMVDRELKMVELKKEIEDIKMHSKNTI